MMPWIKLDDQFFANPKVIELGKDAKLLYLAGLTYCGGQLTDGLISAGALRMLTAMVDVDHTATAELVDANLWHHTDDGFQIHDYLDYQPSAEKVRSERDAAKDRMQRLRSPEVRPNSEPKFARSSPSPSYSRPTPDPQPKPKEETPPLPPEGEPAAGPPDSPPKSLRAVARDTAGFDAFWKAWPKREGKAAALAAWRKVPKDPDTLQAIIDAIPRQVAAKDWPRENWRYCPNPATWLNQRRWEDELPDIRAPVHAVPTTGRPSGRTDGMISPEILDWSRQRSAK